jgi:hypothetical protein
MTINDQRNDNTGGLWLSVSDVARRRGVDKAAVSRRVARLVRDGKLSTRPGRRGVKLINLAAYDLATGESTDIEKVIGAETKKILAGEVDPFAGAPTAADAARLRAAKADQAVYDSELAKLKLAAERRLVLPIRDVELAMARTAELIVSAIERIPTHASDVTAACSREGELGVRKLLKDIAYQLRDTVAREMRLLEQEGKAAEASGLIVTICEGFDDSPASFEGGVGGGPSHTSLSATESN